MYDLHDLHKTSFSVGVISLQDLYDLPEWNLCDLNDLYILAGIRSVGVGGSV